MLAGTGDPSDVAVLVRPAQSKVGPGHGLALVFELPKLPICLLSTGCGAGEAGRQVVGLEVMEVAE